jgi:hypothetical protein
MGIVCTLSLFKYTLKISGLEQPLRFTKGSGVSEHAL